MADQSPAATPEPDGAEPEVATPAGGAESDDSAPVFMNRAARRASANGAKPQRHSQASSGQFGRRGTVQGPRQWGNRRSG